LEQYSHQNPSAKFSLFLTLFQTPEFNTKSPHNLTYKQNPSLPPLNTLSGPTPYVNGPGEKKQQKTKKRYCNNTCNNTTETTISSCSPPGGDGSKKQTDNRGWGGLNRSPY
jgi:hypothetical protein